MDTDSLLHLAPNRVDVFQPVSVTQDGLKLIRFGEQLVREGKRWQEELGIEKQLIRGIDFMAGRHFRAMGGAERAYRAKVVANHFRSIVMREVGLLTDTVPVFKVNSYSGNLIGAEVATDVMQAIWEERNGQQFYTHALLQAIITGNAPCMPIWDKMMDMGQGDLRFVLLDNDQCIVDTHLRRADALQDEAQYIVIRIPRTLQQFRMLYGEYGAQVKADRGLSQFMPSETPKASHVYRRPSRGRAEYEDSAIPRAWEYRCYFVDYQVDPYLPSTKDGRPNFLFPRKRCFAWSGNVLLRDGDAINWDGKFPLEMMDWGYALDHPYGEGELTSIEPLQIAVNLLLSGIVHNSRLQNHPPRFVTEGAMLPQELEELEKYGDMQGKVFTIQPGGSVEDRPPQTMPAVVFQTLQMLQASMESISGMVPVAQGRKEPSVTSGVAIDSLQMAAQVPVRLNSRRAESFLSRFGQLMLSRVIQYYPNDRIMMLTKNPQAMAVLMQRDQFLQQLIQAQTEEEMEGLLQKTSRDFRFKVENESGLGLNKKTKIEEVRRDFEMGLRPGTAVLEAEQVANPEEEIMEAQQQELQRQLPMLNLKMMMAGAGQQPGGGGARSADQQQGIEQTKRNGASL